MAMRAEPFRGTGRARGTLVERGMEVTMITRFTMRRCTFLPAAGVLTLLVACGAANPPPSVRAPEPEPLGSATNASERVGRTSPQSVGEAHRLVIGVTACWLGGVWSDALGVDDEVRSRDAVQRCHTFIKSTYGADDTARYERLRAVERGEVEDLGAKVSSVAKSDPQDNARRDQFVRPLGVIADAERETMYARRAGDKVKKDDTGERKPGKLTGDEIDAVANLKASSSFQALLHADVGDLGPEARAIAVLCAMDRMETARGLPKHLKV